MAFNRGSQPITQDVGKLAISCCKVLIDSNSIGSFSNATFNIDADTRAIKAGYPLRTVQQILDAQNAKATVAFEELGGAAKTLLTAIINSLNTSIVPTYDLQLEVFRPVAKNILISMSGAALLQEFDLSFSNDFNALSLNFEQLVPTGQSLADVVGFSEAAQITYATSSPMLDTGDLSLGLPLVKIGTTSIGAISSAKLSLTTEYRRYEAGQPKTLFQLTPLIHDVVLEVQAEEISTTLLDEDFALSGTSSVSMSVALYDGTTMTITLPEAILSPAGGPSISQSDFAYKTRRFTATGNTLLTIA